DAFGHRRGDEILAGVVERIRTTLRTADHVIRRGGDEFVAILPDTSAEQGLHVAQRVLESIAGQPFAGLPPIRLTVSIGVAAFPADGPSTEALLERADQRSYYAKRTGRGQVIAIDYQLHHTPSWSPERLYDRDHAILDLNAILSSLRNERRVCVHVDGDPGLGRTRLLQEAERLARLRGYATLCLSGQAALRQRVFGVFAHRDSFWSTLPHPALGSQAVAMALQQQLERHHFAGLVLLLDDTDEFDSGTRALVHDLVMSDTVERVLVIAVGMNHSLPLDAYSSIHSLRLTPLTKPSIRAWLRHVLQWEPPLALVQWVNQQSSGIPARIAHLLPKLIEHSILTHHPAGWTL
ncbi:MAG TPA: diguanylate cyclase, partial [Roseiflexaceae bacterium]|nr:diguanylate cyclase [Roseiflexaceae bacterium]